MALKGEKKVLTPEEKFKIQLATETQLLRFQRQYHILECDRKLNKGGSGQKQRKVINILKKEYSEILTDLGVAESSANFKKDLKVCQHLEKLIKEHNHFKCEIKREKAYLNELDMQIVMEKKRIIELRSTTLTEVQTTAKIKDDQRTLEALENKLETATMRFCTTITENHKLRQEIEHLLIERANFNKHWDRLCNNLKHGKKFMLDLIEQATIAYDQREEWCQKLHALRTKAYNEYLTHTNEMTNIQREIDNGDKLKEFLTTKGQKRIMKMLLEKEQQRREQQRRDMEELLQSYASLIEEIRAFMGEESISVVAGKFKLIELNNFSRFKFIVALNRQMEEYADELVALHFRIDSQREMNEVYVTSQAEKLQALQAKYEGTKQAADAADNYLNQVLGTLNVLLQDIQNLFGMCRCANAPLLELLGNNTSINIHNVLLYLKILEDRVNDIMVTIYFRDIKKTRKCDMIHAERMTARIDTITDLVKKDPCPLCVEQTLVSDVIDTLQKVMNKEQITEKLVEAIEHHGFGEVVHNVSGCHLPKSRAIIQRRFQ